MKTLMQTLKKVGRKIFKKTYAKRVSDFYREMPALVSEIISQPNPPETLDNPEIFDFLQTRREPPLQYNYDTFSCWKRGVERAATIIENTRMFEPGASILEVGCGDGMVSAALSGYGHNTTLLDLDDWRDSRSKSLIFDAHNMAKLLPYENDKFDITFSYNSFEHIPNPEYALSEMVRVLRPGGFIFLDFDPLYASAWGLHAWRSLKMPYPQFLFSDSFIEAKINEIGLYDLGKQMLSLQPLNRWRVDQYRQLWKRSNCSIIKLEEARNFNELSIVEEFPKAFRGRGLVLDDLVVHGIRVVLQKPTQH